MIIKGKVYKFGDNINTDLIIPGKYLYLDNPKELAVHAMEGIDSDFNNKIEGNRIIVAGDNFGCGSSREQAAICLKYAGVKAIIAKSFGRIFFRNAINIGMFIIENKDIYDVLDNKDEIKIDISNNYILNISNDKQIEFNPIPNFFLNVIKSNGLINFLMKR